MQLLWTLVFRFWLDPPLTHKWDFNYNLCILDQNSVIGINFWVRFLKTHPITHSQVFCGCMCTFGHMTHFWLPLEVAESWFKTVYTLFTHVLNIARSYGLSLQNWGDPSTLCQEQRYHLFMALTSCLHQWRVTLIVHLLQVGPPLDQKRRQLHVAPAGSQRQRRLKWVSRHVYLRPAIQ